MGKTTIARYFARELPKKLQSCWVVFLDLKKHTKSYFEDGQKKPSVVNFEFLIKLLNLQDDLEVKVFKHFYETRNVIFILDGFDEISPKFKECLLKIIITVKNSKNRLMITTRTHLSKVLENHLNVKALKLNPLQSKDGIELLTKLLCKRQKDENDGVVDELSAEGNAKNLYDKIRNSLTYVSLLDSPLLVTMISELDEEDLEDFNIYTLYERFLKKKIEIRNEKGPLVKDDIVKITMNSTDILQIHRKMALQLLLVDSLQIQKFKIDEEQITRIGLLYFDGENYQFVHRSFAEYFLANYLILNLKNGTTLIASDNFTNVFMSIVQSCMFYVEKRLVEAYLEETKNSLIGQFTVNFTIEETRDFVQASIHGGLENLMCVILANLELDNTQKLELLENPNQRAEGPKSNFFHYWSKVKGNIYTFIVLSDWAKTFMSHEKLHEMFFIQKDEFGESPFFATMINGELNKTGWKSLLTRVSGSLSNIDFNKLLLEKTNYGSLYLHVVPSELFPLFWNSDKVTLDVSNRKKLISATGQNGFNFLMIALQRDKEELVDCILKEAKELFTENELDEYLAFESTNNGTCFHIGARFSSWKVFENLLNFIKDYFDDSRLKSLLMQEDSSEQIILLVYAKVNRHKNTFLKAFSISIAV